MNLAYENQGTNTYLVYKIEDESKVDTLSLGMLTNNRIPGMSPTIFTQMDSEKFIKYNVTARISVRQFFTGAVNRKRLLGVFNGIINTMIAVEDYMIDTQYIVLDLDYIFVDVTTCDTYLICLPVDGVVETEKDLGTFFKKIMFTIQSDGTENCDHIAKILNYLNGSPVFSVTDFKKVLDSINGSGAEQASQPIPQQPVNQPPQQQPTPRPQPIPQQPVNQPPQQQPTPRPQPIPQQPVNQPPRQQPTPRSQPIPQPPVNQPPQQQPTAKQGPQRQQGNGMGGFAIPQNGGQPVQQPQPQAPAGQSDEKKMSFFHLMMHYSKENADLYKKQKEAGKAQSAQAVNVPGAPVPAGKGKTAPNMGVAIPGQPNPPVARAQNVPGMPNAGQMPNAPAVPRAGQAPNVPGIPGIPGMQNAGQSAAYQRPPQQMPNQQAGARPVPNQVNPQPNPVIPQQAPVNPQPTPVIPQPDPVQKAGDAARGGYGGVVVVGAPEAEGTTVLGAGQNPERNRVPYLIRTKNNEKIAVNKPTFHIGKERSYADYCVSDNPAVSRSHADIVSKDGEYFIVDTNSTNHTFINGKMIQSSVEVRLQSGDKIRLANEEFDFQLL